MSLENKLNKLENLLDFISPKVSLSTFFDSVSEYIDEHLCETIQLGRKFIGGKANFYLSSNGREIIIEVVLYFFDTMKQEYRKQEFGGTFLFDRLLKGDQAEFRGRIDREGKWCVEVVEPTEV